MRESGIHIRIADIIYGIIKRRFLIIGLAVAGLLVGVVFSCVSYLRGDVTREYLITSSFSVNTQTSGGRYTSGSDIPDSNDIYLAEDLVDAVSYAIRSDRMMNAVIDNLRLLGVTPIDINNNLVLSQYNDTQIIEMGLYWRNANEGIAILNEINNNAPSVLGDTLRLGNIAVINQPTAKYVVGGQVNLMLWGYLAVLGMALGFGIALLELIMRPTLINLQDMEDVFGLETLCMISEDKAYFRRGRSMLVDDKSSSTGEDFASAAHIIQNRFRNEKGPHIIYVTSALRGEGKTRMIANIAVRLSDLENKVLMIDFDMKNPDLSGMFLKNMQYEHSLNALYDGEITEADAITNLSGYLDILPTVLEKNSISLDSSLFEMIRRVAANYDYVLIDTAPVGVSADPMSLNEIADAALFVVRYDTASMQEIRDAIDRVEKSGVDILGCIINGIKVSEKGINNPVKERSQIKKAETRDRKKKEKTVVTVAPDPDLKYNRPAAEKAEADLLVAGFAKHEETGEEASTSEALTSTADFVDKLFEASDNTRQSDEAEDKTDPSDASKEDDFDWDQYRYVKADEEPEDKSSEPLEQPEAEHVGIDTAPADNDMEDEDPLSRAHEMYNSLRRANQRPEVDFDFGSLDDLEDDNEALKEEAGSTPGPTEHRTVLPHEAEDMETEGDYAGRTTRSIGRSQQRMADLLKELDELSIDQ